MDMHNLDTSVDRTPIGFEAAVSKEEVRNISHAAKSTSLNCIKCHVCHRDIYFPRDEKCNALKCSSCQEATPVKAAPSGKRYARCPCNALLLTELSNPIIRCPRQACNRLVNLDSAICVTQALPSTTSSLTDTRGAKPTRSAQPVHADRFGFVRAKCFNCNRVSLISKSDVCEQMCSKNPRCLCPLCGRKSVIGEATRRCKVIQCLITGFVLVFLGIGLGIGLGIDSPNLAVILIAPLLVGIFSLLMGAYWKFGVSVSQILDEDHA